MAGLWSLVKTWIADETLTSSDLNAEFEGVQQNAVASQIEGTSTVNNVNNNAAMDSQVAPFPSSVRSFASSVAGEIQRLRYMISAITGLGEWYDPPTESISTLVNNLSSLGLIQNNKVVSGRTNDQMMPIALQADGTVATVTLRSGVVPTVVTIAGTQYTFNTNQSATGLSLAPSSNNTALIDVAGAVGPYAGEDGTKIVINTVGSNITALIGQYAAFQVVHASVVECFIGYVESATLISRCFRAYFQGSALAFYDRQPIAAADTLTLLRLTYVFVKTDGTLDVTYNPLAYGADQPTSPSSGDYWYDTVNQLWKKYSGTTWTSSGATLLGASAQDSTKCLCTRTFEFYAPWDKTNSIFCQLDSSQVTAVGRTLGQRISVSGHLYDYQHSVVKFPISGPFAPTITFATNTQYFFYISSAGESIIDTVKPYDRQADLGGFYHPHFLWRCIGFNVSSTSSTWGTAFVNQGEPLYPPVPTGDSYAEGGQITSSTTSNTPVVVCSLTIRCSGGPLLFVLCGDGGDQGTITYTGTGGSFSAIDFYITMDTTSVFSGQVVHNRVVLGTNTSITPNAAMTHIYTSPVSAGEHSFYFQASTANGSIAFSHLSLKVKELA